MKDAPTIHWTGDREDLVKKSQGQYSELEAKDGKKNVHVHGKESAGTHRCIPSERTEVHVGIGDAIGHAAELKRDGNFSVAWVLVVTLVTTRRGKRFGTLDLRVDVVSGLGGDTNEGGSSVDSTRWVAPAGRGGDGDRVALDGQSLERNSPVIFIGFVDRDVVNTTVIQARVKTTINDSAHCSVINHDYDEMYSPEKDFSTISLNLARTIVTPVPLQVDTHLGSIPFTRSSKSLPEGSRAGRSNRLPCQAHKTGKGITNQIIRCSSDDTYAFTSQPVHAVKGKKKHTKRLISDGEAAHGDGICAKRSVGVARSICNVESVAACSKRRRGIGVKGVCLFAKAVCTCRTSDPAKNTGARVVSQC